MADTAQDQNIKNPTQTDDKVVIGQGQYTHISSSMNKEIAPSMVPSEVIKPSEPEPKLSSELTSVGISVNTDKPKLDEVHEKIGVSASLESTPVVVSKSTNVVLPMTEEEVDKTLGMKQSKFNLNESVGEFAGDYTEDSLPFFATLIKKIFKEMHKKMFGSK
jgi:hypothetical protein